MVEDKVQLVVVLRAAARCVTSRVGPGPFRVVSTKYILQNRANVVQSSTAERVTMGERVTCLFWYQEVTRRPLEQMIYLYSFPQKQLPYHYMFLALHRANAGARRA